MRPARLAPTVAKAMILIALGAMAASCATQDPQNRPVSLTVTANKSAGMSPSGWR